MSEADNPKTTFLFLFILGAVVALIAMVLGVQHYFDGAVRDEISRKVLQPESSALRLLRSEELAKLTHYQWADQKSGVVRLPVERAWQLVLEGWDSRPTGFTPGSSEPAATPSAPPTSAKPENPTK